MEREDESLKGTKLSLSKITPSLLYLPVARGR